MAERQPGVKPVYPPQLVAWETTRRCGLKCSHCRAAAQDVRYEGELTTDEGRRLLANIASFSKPIIILTGGEPLMRPDIYDLASYGTSLGLRMALATCGVGLTESVAKRFKECGIQRLSLSIDGSTAETHDCFRNVPGAFDTALKAAEVAKNAGLPFQINTTLSRINVDDLPAILELAIKIGASAFHPFLLVPVGRGQAIESETLDPHKYESILSWIAEQQATTPIPFKPTCAPHFHRIIRQKKLYKPATHGHGHPQEQGHDHPGGLDTLSRGCLGGLGFVFISHVGEVQICGFLEESAGNVRKENFDFKHIWETSPLFTRLREKKNYRGRCGVCGYWKVCGGCRARGKTMNGHYLEEEPNCLYQPESASDA
jgi:heme b synthase